MKKVFSSLILFFTIISLTAQDTWSTLLPETTDDAWVIEDMVKTNDGGFAILGNFLAPIYLYKYDAEGGLLWEKTHLFGENNFMFPRDMVELSNGNLAIIGDINTPAWYQFVFITNSEGDSLSLQLYTEYEHFRNLATDGNQLFFMASNVSGQDSIFTIKTDSSGALLEHNHFPCLCFVHVNTNGQNIINLENQSDSIVFNQHSFEGDLEISKKYFNDLGLNHLALIQQSTQGNLGFYQEEGMLILDHDFNLLYTLPVDSDHLDIPQTGWPLLPEHVLGTSDGGFLLTGYAWNANLPFEQSMVYMIKLSAIGEVEWKRVYNGNYSLALNNARHVVEVDDGYVFVGVDLEYGQIWLVKFNDEGWFTGTEELNERRAVEVYPNPCTDILNLELPEGINSGQIVIYDAQGEQVAYHQLQSNQKQIETSSLCAGIYYLEVRDGHLTDRTYSARFVRD